jgi:hypothetical protein
MKTILAALACLMLVACAAGPVYMAKNETESKKVYYEDPALAALYQKNTGLIQDIYARFSLQKVNFYREGLGFTTIQDRKGTKHPCLMVYIRPGDVYFDENKTKPEERFGAVLSTSFTKYLSSMKREDVENRDIEGLAFGIYWPVRDYSQCDTYGGFVEYAIMFMKKDDFLGYMDGDKTFEDLAESTEIIASLNSGPARSIKPVFTPAS